jgi:negative regulator of sigma-B (phosphoserine phosphatase)
MTETCRHRLDYYGLVRPRVGYHQAGDAVVIVEHSGKLLAGIVDVLGHGPEAHDVALKAQRFLDNDLEPGNPLELLRGLHSVLRGTRGAAAGLAVLDAAEGLVRYVGVGNTAIRRFGTVADRLVSVDGIVGGTMRTAREQQMRLSPRDIVVMYSDGVRDHFELSEYPQLLLGNAETIARTVIRRFAKEHDDAACIALRYDP